MQGLKNVLLNDEFSPICYLYIMYVAICVSLCVCMYVCIMYVCIYLSTYPFPIYRLSQELKAKQNSEAERVDGAQGDK